MRGALLLAIVLVAACQPTFDRPPWLVDGPRIPAVRSDPAEAAPGQPVSLRALLVTPIPADGTRLAWAFCERALTVAENVTVSPDCLRAEADFVVPIAEVPAPASVDASLPSDGCALFGSEPPPPAPGEPPRRPVDPDASGGYYQPVRVTASSDVVAFGRVRLACALPGAPVAIARDFRARYMPNRNPELVVFGLADGAALVASGARVRLHATLAADADEPYVRYDADGPSLVDALERLEVSWLTTAGTLGGESSPVTSGVAEIDWVAPATPGPVTLWAIARDDRGGSSFRALTVTVAP